MTSSPNRMTRLADMLSPETIVLNSQAQEKNKLLYELISRIPELASRPAERDKLYQAVLERETLHSTGIGDGIALPHSRSVLAGLLSKPAIVMARLDVGVPYGSIDGVPVRLVFLIVATQTSEHLHILARISRLLRQPNFRKDLLAVDTAASALALFQTAEAHLFEKT